MPRFPVLLLQAVTLGCCVCASAQNPAAPSAEELTRSYIEHAKAAADNQQNYTFIVLHRNLNYIKGNLTADNTTKSEQIFIGGLPYVRRLERNGKPLAGKDLEKETELYDKAMRERTGLTDEVRRRLRKEKTFSSQGIPNNKLEADFRKELAGREVIDGHECVVLELTPARPDLPQEEQRHIRLSINTATGDVLHFWVEYLAADHGFSKGTVLDHHFFYLNGVLLTRVTKVDTTVHASSTFHSADIHLIGTDEFSNYRRFGATVTLGPASVIPDGSPDDAPR